MQRNHSPSSKLLLGLSLLVLGAILVFGKPPSISKSFAEEPVRIEGLDQERQGEEPKRIVIPSLGVDLEVKRAEIINGYWEVFPRTAGWGEGSGFPGEEGNQVIFAHAREGLFLPLRKVNKGMKVYVFTEDNWHEYTVREVKEVLPSEVEVIAPTEDETLTLYTCSGFNDAKRLIVVAKP